MYELRYTLAAQKYFKKIQEKGLRKAFENGLTNIAENPYIGSAPGSTNDKGQVYDPVFGWVTPSTVQQEVIGGDGDPNKMVGSMD